MVSRYLDIDGNRYTEPLAELVNDESFVYGLSTDTPIVGDWDGDGDDEFGIFRGGTTFVLDTEDYKNSSQDPSVIFNLAGEQAVVGNFYTSNSPGDEIGIYKDGAFYLVQPTFSVDQLARDSATVLDEIDLQKIEVVPAAVSSSYLPIVGDWSKFGGIAGHDHLGLYRIDTGDFYLDTQGVLLDGDTSNDNLASLTAVNFGSNLSTEILPLTGNWKPDTFAPASEFFVATGLDAVGSGVVQTFRASDLSRWLFLNPYDDLANFGITGPIGVNVALGDVNRDGIPDLMTAPDQAFDLIRIYDGTLTANIEEFKLWEFYAYEDYEVPTTAPSPPHTPGAHQHWGGVNISSTDINQDGYADIIVSPGHVGHQANTPPVRVFSGAPNGRSTPDLLLEFYPFNLEYNDVAVLVDTGDVNFDGYPDSLHLRLTTLRD
ncbi:Hypothetical protein PBC10988_10010 [Planctomycetales bacterium 10988]|nr:Hypothetical protein PBC10988_10010 [Planctomycetales bacterium 10988]